MTEWWKEDQADEFAVLSMRARNALFFHGIKTVDQLRAASREELMALPNFGRHCLQQVICLLRSLDEK